jgi:hypothetical protein
MELDKSFVSSSPFAVLYAASTNCTLYLYIILKYIYKKKIYSKTVSKNNNNLVSENSMDVENSKETSSEDSNNNENVEVDEEESDEYVAYLVNKTDIFSFMFGSDQNSASIPLGPDSNNVVGSNVINMCCVGKPQESYVICAFSNGKIARYSADLKKVVETLDLVSTEVYLK